MGAEIDDAPASRHSERLAHAGRGARKSSKASAAVARHARSLLTRMQATSAWRTLASSHRRPASVTPTGAPWATGPRPAWFAYAAEHVPRIRGGVRHGPGPNGGFSIGRMSGKGIPGRVRRVPLTAHVGWPRLERSPPAVVDNVPRTAGGHSRRRHRVWIRSPWGPKMASASAGPSTAPSQCGVRQENSAASPGSRTKSSSPSTSRSLPERT
jgi:hypothetical protein